MTQNEAIKRTIDQIYNFDRMHGRNALEDAINAGAFCYQPDYGDVSEIFIYRDYDIDTIDVPIWVSDIYKEHEQVITTYK